MTDRFKRADDRDVRVAKDRQQTDGAPMEPWHEEPTGVHTDVQVFRAVKALGEELQKSKLEAARAHGALKNEVTTFKTAVDERLTRQDRELHTQSLALAKMSGQLDVLVPITRMRPSSAETKAVEAEKTKRALISRNGKIIIAIVSAAIAVIGILYGAS